METITSMEQLLDEIKTISSKFEAIETFNAFRSIGFWSQELMHSRFIAEMLNPSGSHKMSDQFLKLFLKQISDGGFISQGARVGIEERAITRWIDLIIETPKKDSVIVVENKLYAKDQNRQLADYYNFCKGKYRQVKMVYLTLNGKRPTLESVGEQRHEDALKMEDIVCISYEKHIIPWIDECSNLPNLPNRVKCALEMYSELVTDLINRNKYMDAIFEELKADKEKLKLALEINKSLEGRDYIIEFPEIRNLLEEIVKSFEGDEDVISNAYSYNDELAFEVRGSSRYHWSLRFDDGKVFFTDDHGTELLLFYNRDIANLLLESLLLEDKNTACQIVNDKLIELINLSKLG